MYYHYYATIEKNEDGSHSHAMKSLDGKVTAFFTVDYQAGPKNLNSAALAYSTFIVELLRGPGNDENISL